MFCQRFELLKQEDDDVVLQRNNHILDIIQPEQR